LLATGVPLNPFTVIQKSLDQAAMKYPLIEVKGAEEL
jgi:hypothetical protein